MSRLDLKPKCAARRGRVTRRRRGLGAAGRSWAKCGPSALQNPPTPGPFPLAKKKEEVFLFFLGSVTIFVATNHSEVLMARHRRGRAPLVRKPLRHHLRTVPTRTAASGADRSGRRVPPSGRGAEWGHGFVPNRRAERPATAEVRRLQPRKRQRQRTWAHKENGQVEDGAIAGLR